MAERPDVLYVVLDSLRKDRVSAYGHHRETTPNLDRFAENATTFENAYVPAPWTLPSHCSTFTGNFPSEHGVTNGFTDRDLTLPAEFETVTERLSEQGYRTAGFSSNPWVGKVSGLESDFDRFVEWDLETTQGTPRRRRDVAYSRTHSVLGRLANQPLVVLKRRFFTKNLVTRAEGWIREGTGARRWSRQESGPTFTFLNLMEAHSPYYPPEWAFEVLGLDSPGTFEARSLNTKLLASVLGKRSLSGDEKKRVMDFLDASVRFQDRQFGRLLSALQATGRYEGTRVVVCADHGKTLGGFDRDGDVPHYLRDCNVSVPLFLKRAGQTERDSVAAPVEMTDLAAFLTGDGSLEPRAEGAVIEDFLPHTASESQAVTRWRALATGDRKYLRSEDGEEFLLRGRGLEESVVPLGSVEDGTVQAMRERLADRVEAFDHRGTEQAESESGLDGEVASQLEDLGYLG
jgi:arylsulfatase A-like enzyme